MYMHGVSPGTWKTCSSSGSGAADGSGCSSVTQPVIEPRGAAITPSASRGHAIPHRQLIAAHTSSTRWLTCGGPEKRPVVFRRYHSSRCVILEPV